MNEQWEIIKFVDASYEQCKQAVKLNASEALPYVIKKYPDHAVRILCIDTSGLHSIETSTITDDFLWKVINYSTTLYASMLVTFPKIYKEEMFIAASKRYAEFIGCRVVIRFVSTNGIVDPYMFAERLEDSLPKMSRPDLTLHWMDAYGLSYLVSEDLLIHSMHSVSDSYIFNIRAIVESYSLAWHRASIRLIYEVWKFKLRVFRLKMKTKLSWFFDSATN